jgi:hypothetical protein
MHSLGFVQTRILRLTPQKFIIMKNITQPLFTVFACCALVASVSGQIMISETWSDGDRTNQSLPNSLAWYSSGATAGLTASSANGGSMTQSLGSASHVVGFLTDTHGQKIELAVGQAIQLNFEVSFQNLGATGNYFRFGLFDSSQVDPRITVDNNGTDGYERTKGSYVNMTNINEGATVEWRRRSDGRTNLDSGHGHLITSTSAAFAAAGTTSTSMGETLLSDVIYTGILTIMRTDISESVITASLSGPDGLIYEMGSWTETNSFVFTTGYDTVAFASSASNGDSFTLHSMDISVIPEPSTMALLFGFMALGAVCHRRVVKS